MKYWGKVDAALNIPAVGSISITLDGLWTDTEVEFDESLKCDMLLLDGHEDPAALERVTRCLDVLRAQTDVSVRARVVSRNNFPTGAGLASSASGFAALAAAAATALELDLTPRELSIVARRGSGSAARSIFGGFVEMHTGGMGDGEDSYAEPLLDAADWPLRVVVAIASAGPKETGSSVGMQSSAATSPYYSAWIASSHGDLDAARQAIRERDFSALSAVSEQSCLKFHGLAISSEPSLIYWKPATLACIAAVKALRERGTEVFFTIDAGPQLKAVCAADCVDAVANALGEVEGVLDVIVTGLGPGVEMRA